MFWVETELNPRMTTKYSDVSHGQSVDEGRRRTPVDVFETVERGRTLIKVSTLSKAIVSMAVTVRMPTGIPLKLKYPVAPTADVSRVVPPIPSG